MHHESFNSMPFGTCFSAVSTVTMSNGFRAHFDVNVVLSLYYSETLSISFRCADLKKYRIRCLGCLGIHKTVQRLFSYARQRQIN